MGKTSVYDGVFDCLHNRLLRKLHAGVQPPSVSAAHEICKCKRLHLSLLAVSTERWFGTQSVRLFYMKTVKSTTFTTKKAHLRLDSKQTICGIVAGVFVRA